MAVDYHYKQMNKNGWTKIWQSKDTRLLSIKSILFENNIFIVVLAGKNHSIKEKMGYHTET